MNVEVFLLLEFRNYFIIKIVVLKVKILYRLRRRFLRHCWLTSSHLTVWIVVIVSCQTDGCCGKLFARLRARELRSGSGRRRGEARRYGRWHPRLAHRGISAAAPGWASSGRRTSQTPTTQCCCTVGMLSPATNTLTSRLTYLLTCRQYLFNL